MASVRERSGRYHVRHTDADGRRHESRGFTDKRVAQQRARELEREVDRVKAGLVTRAELVERDHAACPIASHLEAYRDHLLARGSTVKHAGQATYRVGRVLDLARIDRLAALEADRVQEALKALRDQGLSLQSCNHHRAAARAFARWVWKTGRSKTHTLLGVTGYNVKEDRRHDRRTLGIDELRRLIEAAHSGPPWRGITGPLRALCYRLAVSTGLRHAEIASITPESFDWSASPATVTVAAAYTKNGDSATLPLPSDLAADLRAHVGTLADGTQVFPLIESKGAAMLRKDLERAGIPYRDSGGLVFDFHALRCQCATLADQAGVTPRVVQRMMRHSTLELTGRYTRPRPVDLNRAAESLPSLRPEPSGPEVSVLPATGIDNGVSHLPPILPHTGVRTGPVRTGQRPSDGCNGQDAMKRLTPENTVKTACCPECGGEDSPPESSVDPTEARSATLKGVLFGRLPACRITSKRRHANPG
jgi:integrase